MLRTSLALAPSTLRLNSEIGVDDLPKVPVVDGEEVSMTPSASTRERKHFSQQVKHWSGESKLQGGHPCKTTR